MLPSVCCSPEIQHLLELGFKFLISYFIGSILGSMIMGVVRGGVDIRTMGSGNAGGTNALRTQGLLFAIGVIIIDVGKGALATAVVPGLDLPFVGVDPDVSRVWLTLACAAAAVAGHVWPMWHDFRGGKGAATLLGTLIILSPTLILPVMLVWVWVLIMSGYVGLATVFASMSAPLYLAFAQLPDGKPLIIYCAALALIIAHSHRTNMQRMRAGTENRVVRLQLFRRKDKQGDD
jgi:glycerol-3-phosphate acyltransferase PlsY